MQIDFKANNTKMIDIDKIEANNYNPNRMPKKEMELLKDCIKKYGFLFPIIVVFDKDKDKYIIVDGFHRYETLKNIGANEICVVELYIPIKEAIKLTVLMNRIKGMHQVEKMSNLVELLSNLGAEDQDIQKSLGMETEEILRLKQQLGIAHAFKNHEYSKSWESV